MPRARWREGRSRAQSWLAALPTRRETGSTYWVWCTGKTLWTRKNRFVHQRHLSQMREVICRQPGGEQQGPQNQNLLDLSAERGTPIILPEVADKSFMLAGFPVAQQRRHHREGNNRQGCGDLGTGEYVGEAIHALKTAQTCTQHTSTIYRIQCCLSMSMQSEKWWTRRDTRQSNWWRTLHLI